MIEKFYICFFVFKTQINGFKFNAITDEEIEKANELDREIQKEMKNLYPNRV